MFKPEEIIFAPTALCNLVCGHCRVARVPQELDASLAVAFMKSCWGKGIERIGFSGGEPFLRPDFLYEVCRSAVELDYYFGRLMTNGCWADDQRDFEAVLLPLYESGFDGTFGLSFDSWHGNDVCRAAGFLRAVFDIWGRKDCAEILAVEAPGSAQADEQSLRELATALGGSVQTESTQHGAAIVDQTWLAKTEADPDDGSALYLPVHCSPYSAAASGEGSWGADAWFEDDYCRGPGNVFYVHPTGAVAVCCGFANENDQLMIGNLLSCTYDSLMQNATDAPMVSRCYQTGLAAVARTLQSEGFVFPGSTQDMCFFCDYLCKTGSRYQSRAAEPARQPDA
jgi:hypothetical protein